MGFFHKFMYSAFEQSLSMKRVLYKFGIIIIIIIRDVFWETLTYYGDYNAMTNHWVLFSFYLKVHLVTKFASE